MMNIQCLCLNLNGMNKKKRDCNKCKGNHFCDAHHILPKTIFGDGETEFLCKNCHDEYHRHLGHKFLRKKNSQSEEFYFLKYYKWLAGLCIIIGFVLFFIYKF